MVVLLRISQVKDIVESQYHRMGSLLWVLSRILPRPFMSVIVLDLDGASLLSAGMSRLSTPRSG